MSILTSAFHRICENKASTYLTNHIEESITFQSNIFRNRIKKVHFDILNDISENVTLVKLMESIGNVNHDISISGYWIIDSSYEKSLHMTRGLLDIIFFPSISEEQVETFESYFTLLDACAYSPGNLNIG